MKVLLDAYVWGGAMSVQRSAGHDVEWVGDWSWVDEPAPGCPRALAPRGEDAAKALKKRTLTNLYNARPQWLADAQNSP